MKTLLAALVLSTAALHAQSPDRQAAEAFDSEVTLKVSYRYLLSLPDGYQADNAKRWPLIIFLHGAGERGQELEMLKKHGPPKLIAAGQSIPAVVVSPQCAPGTIWNPHAVHALTQAMIGKHRVDPDRVYLTGLSMGGFGTWETAMEYPQTYAALIPICGGVGVRFIMADRIKHIPEWIFHGAKDSVVSPAFSQQMHQILSKLGTPVQLTLYPEAQHDSWTATYNKPEVWAWLFKQKR